MSACTDTPNDCSVSFWRPFFESKAINFAQQQDALEALQVMCQDVVMDALMMRLGRVVTKLHYHVVYPCQHVASKSVARRRASYVLELLPGHVDGFVFLFID